jgi:hypothetical protein
MQRLERSIASESGSACRFASAWASTNSRVLPRTTLIPSALTRSRIGARSRLAATCSSSRTAASSGPMTPEAAGDYVAGLSHVLPTDGVPRGSKRTPAPSRSERAADVRA